MGWKQRGDVMTLPAAWLDELRARTLLSSLIGKSTKISKAGREWKACCPFHNEKTPSFTINDEKGFYHCFGCGAHGDAIRWMTDQRGLPFMDAVKELAEAAGLDVPAPDPRAAERAERANSLHDVMKAAADWFTEQLGSIEGAEARTYLEKRGLKTETIRTFGLGFAPDSRGKLRAALKQFGDDKLIEAGLLISVDDKEPYDRFRGRLMIPIRDPRGRVIAFGGRILGQGEPKYLNSPDTPLFDKGRTLYNLDLASPASRKTGRMLVVEGYMDVIALAQAGLGEAVAPLGTALTEHQIERLWRQVDVPILCFDGDAAGQKAAVRAIGRALPGLAPSRSLSFVTLPQGQDPDDLIKSGGRAAMEALLAAPEPLVDRLWRHELDALPLTTPEARAGFRQRMGGHAQAIDNGNVREQYQSEFRARFDALFSRRAAFQKINGFRPTEAPPSASARAIGGMGIERAMMGLILNGLTRYPQIVATHYVQLADLVIVDPEQARMRDAMLAAAGNGQCLDAITISAPCATGLTLRIAEVDLGVAIDVLAAQSHIDRAIASATKRLSRRFDEESFAEQVRLHQQHRVNAERLSDMLCASDD